MNGRRAREWQLGLQTEGISVIQVRTSGKDSEKGPWQIAVVEADAARARDFIDRVIQGQVELPELPSKFPPLGAWALVVLSALALALFAVSLLGC